ncbi:MAG TPA: TMEM175 family protein, partial [Acidimicrobiales bacterium]|nr:TMEM175 family protein [Acidimicrobiales bacterium]
METKRIEAFSDGVFAVAITLLVLNLQPPEHTPDHLWNALRHQWPSYAAFVVSFFVIGIIWVNHHGVFRNIAQADRILMFINLMLLFFVVLLPFCTALLADNLRRNVNNIDSQIAAAIYSGTMLAMSVTFQALWRWSVKDGRLLHQHVDPVQARAASRRFGFGLVV